jgi:zinc transport system ATP-binding protein
MASNTTLEFSIDGQLIFSSSGKWLHPLFELEEFLKAHAGVDPARAHVRDKIIGRGSAFLIVRMGIRKVHAGVLSRLGKDVLDRAGAACTWDQLVDTIQCRTEGLLRDTTDPQDAYRVLADLAGADSLLKEAEPAASPSALPGAPGF